MRKLFGLVILIGALGALAACGNRCGPYSDGWGGQEPRLGVFYEDDMQWITFDELGLWIYSDKDMLLLDVRREDAWGIVRIEGSINTHAMNFMGEGNQQAFADAIYPALSQAGNKPVVVLCNSGSSGVRATWSGMMDMGFDMSRVYLLVGGVNHLQVEDAPFVIRD